MVSYLLAFFISLFLTPIVIKFNKKFDLLEEPSNRKIHTIAVAKFGGVSIFISSMAFVHYLGFNSNIYFIYLSFIIITLTGIIDDYKPLNPYIKLLLQLCAIVIILFCIYRIGSFKNINIIFICVIIFWFLFCTNSINLIDGVDSLACGVSIMILAYLSYLFCLSHEVNLAQYCLILLAAIWGFLIFNFPSATIFLGDTGSLFIGFNISLLTIIYFLKEPGIERFLIILSLCTIPVVDSLYAIIRRIIKGASPFKGDLEHIHHKLYYVGSSANFVVVVLFILQIIITVLLIYFKNIITIEKLLFIYVFSIIYIYLIIKLFKNFGKCNNTNRIIRPSPTELAVFFIVDLACVSFILIPQWAIIISFVFLFIPYIAIFSYERLKYLLNVILIFTIFLFFLNYVTYDIRFIAAITIFLFFILILTSSRTHFSNLIKINGDDLLFINGLILLVQYANLSLINSIILFVFSIILYFYNKKYLLLLC
jgi:UDP-GlcNAc:undecaprenyl-phosphate GlcNAc-1-phosphate transferase